MVEPSSHYQASQFFNVLEALLRNATLDPNVVAFKTIVCYRTGLNVTLAEDVEHRVVEQSLHEVLRQPSPDGKFRLQNKPLNDWLVRTTLKIAGQRNLPGQPSIVHRLCRKIHKLSFSNSSISHWPR
jgi:hypothetical protein